MKEIPQDLVTKAYDVLSAASQTGKIRKGANEATKAIERKQAQLVVIASDVSPPEIVAHLGPLCEEKGITFVHVPKKEELGRAAGMTVPTAAVAVVEPGDGKGTLADLLGKLKTLKGGKAPAAEKPAEAKKEEAPKEEKKEEKPKEETPKEEPKVEEAKEEKK